ncbi:Acetyltransferase, putative [Shewanella piezotolerans WP3]|uniref:Acetyltransferase, putative n=1 Tax=Shewanella piezotolerans (strain WP3 / JCM 13877) TaxID=225849 RepID=B8CGW9_SHEPW|nr:GNAT family N-acetyltransferase [Shewanella piezotolerans]ACJ26962.1 Acetyltransferase, putative [Shewanella piezotolerans WP3]
MSENITHLPDEQQFVINIGTAQAVLTYELSTSNTALNSQGLCNFSHTFVPKELRGKGLAEKLVRHGLSWAKSQGLEIDASCWYVQKFLSKT